MTKIEKIQEAYGEHWEKVKDWVDSNGWTNQTHYLFNFNLNLEFKEIGTKGSKLFTQLVRPISLQGIETNNGWIKIESEADYPKIEGEYWCIDTIEPDKIKQKTFPLGKPQFKLEFEQKWWCKYITHYQLISKPLPPIY